MISTLEFNFSQTFPGKIWSTVAVPSTSLIAIEARNDETREVSFSVLDFSQNKFVRKNKIFEESWWIGLTAASHEVLFLHVFENTDNPDHKGLLAWHIQNDKLLWQLDDFILNYLDDKYLYGSFIKDELSLRVIDIFTGKEVPNVSQAPISEENISVQMPFQYIDGNEHFETVKSFLTSKLKVIPILGVEYLEWAHHIFISYLVFDESLANYLVVFTSDGEFVLQEKLDEHLKGLGLGTFFTISDCLFFIRNKSELISYKIV